MIGGRIVPRPAVPHWNSVAKRCWEAPVPCHPAWRERMSMASRLLEPRRRQEPEGSRRREQHSCPSVEVELVSCWVPFPRSPAAVFHRDNWEPQGNRELHHIREPYRNQGPHHIQEPHRNWAQCRTDWHKGWDWSGSRPKAGSCLATRQSTARQSAGRRRAENDSVEHRMDGWP